MKSENKSTLCNECKKLAREKHAKFKNIPKLKKSEKYQCTVCKLFLGVRSFSRGGSKENLICKRCKTDIKIEESGEFRCRSCGSVFPKQYRFWNKYCVRCYEKNKIWNKEKMKQLRKDPYWSEYFRSYSRWKYHNVFKPLYNKVLTLQWEHGLAKKRKINRDGAWFCLNRAMFNDFRKRPRYWYGLTMKVINEMRTGKSNSEMRRNIKPLNEYHPYVQKYGRDPQWVKDNLD